MPYLGIQLTTPSSNLYAYNYTPFLQTCKKDLQLFSKQYLFLAGRMADFKMIALPKLLYLYRALPIVDILRHSFVWQDQKPHCPYASIIKHKSAGGMGFPDVNDYHTAVILDQIRHWFISSCNKQWQHIEQSFIAEGDWVLSS